MARRVWVAELPFPMTIPAEAEVMVEVFTEDGETDIVNVAFRPDRQAVWGPPIQAEER